MTEEILARLPNMRDVAQAANVSLITVSRALREPQKVRAETRERIQEAIARINYVPHLAARSLQKSHSDIVAVLLPSVQNSAFAATAQGLLDVLEPEGYQLMIGSIGDFQDPQVEQRLVSAFLGRRPDAMVLTGRRRNGPTSRLLRQAKIPIVCIWSTGRVGRYVSVGPDNRGESRRMTLGLVERGYRRIGYLGGRSKWNDIVQARRQGFLDAINEAEIGLPPNRMLEIDAPASMKEIGAAFRMLLQQAPEIDAIFCPGDHYAISALLRANADGVDVPGRVAIAGFGDLELASLLTPSLTTVRVDAYQLGSIAGTEVLAALRRKGELRARSIKVACELVWREST